MRERKFDNTQHETKRTEHDELSMKAQLESSAVVFFYWFVNFQWKVLRKVLESQSGKASIKKLCFRSVRSFRKLSYQQFPSVLLTFPSLKNV